MVEDKNTSMIDHVNNTPTREKVANFHRRFFIEKDKSGERVFDEKKLVKLFTYMMIDNVDDMNEEEREKYFTNHKDSDLRTFPLQKDLKSGDLEEVVDEKEIK